jgi:hypothetical protein
MSRFVVKLFVLCGLGLVVAVSAASLVASPAEAQQAQRQAARSRAPQHPKVDFDIPCAECHTRRTPAVVEQWQQSKHSPNVGCFICHGDGEVEFNPKPDTSSCMTCHAARVEDMRRAPVQNCFACHNSHRLKFHR